MPFNRPQKMYKQAVLFQYEAPPSKHVGVVLTVLSAHN